MKRFTAKSVAVSFAALVLAVAPLRAADIVDTAAGAGSFNTLVAAVKAAGLVDTLKSEGPFTVFAPTDEAFAKLPAGTVETLLKPENRDQLVAILTYHVVAGKVPATDVVKLSGADTVNGQRVDITVDDGSVMVDAANVSKTDIETSNGIIHIIDSVLLPTDGNIPAVADQAGTFKTLLAAATAAGLVDALSADGPLTVFAPTDDAFAKLPEGTVESLLKPENRDQLTAILTYHVVPGRIYSDAALRAGSAKTLQGQPVRIAADDSGARVNESNLIATDVDAANGVIHVIDTVLMPPTGDKVSAAHRIKDAVAHGSRLYNRGHHAACAKVYAETARAVAAHAPQHVAHRLTSALNHFESTSCQMTRAWTLRHALDDAYAAMRPIE